MTAEKQLLETERGRRLMEWFAAKLAPNFAGVTEMTRVSGGASNETLLLDVSCGEGGRVRSRKFVVRVQPAPSHDCFLGADVLKQSALLRAIKARSDIPVPVIFGEEADSHVLGAKFFVMEFVEGKVPSTFPSFHATGWVTQLQPVQRRAMDENALRQLAAIHEFPCDGDLSFLAEGRRGSPGLDNLLCWVEDYCAWACEDVTYPLLEIALRYLRRAQPQNEQIRLNWGDCRLGNMMFSPDQSVAAILDWENAFLGPPEADLGWWIMMNWWQSEGSGAKMLDGFLSRDETVSCYESLVGRRIDDVDYYEILAFTRYVILSVRSTNLLIKSGAVPEGSTLAIGSPLGRKLAELLHEPLPEFSPDYLRIIARYQEGERPALEG